MSFRNSDSGDLDKLALEYCTLAQVFPSVDVGGADSLPAFLAKQSKHNAFVFSSFNFFPPPFSFPRTAWLIGTDR